jgi:hypothetical protein
MADRVPAKTLLSHRQRTFRLLPELVLASEDDAIRFVNERGFVFFWPIQGIVFPSLWAAVAGDRPVASEHDDAGHITWGWKDGLLDKKRWYYAKVIRGKASMISLEIAPYFYALTENYGEPERDYLEQYQDGRLSHPAKVIYEILMDDGPTDSVQLKRKARLSSDASKSVFDRSLVELQRDFKILPMGVSDSGAWRYSFLFDLVHRYYPEIPERARLIAIAEARQKLARLYIESTGAAALDEIQRFFSWPAADARRALDHLVKEGEIRDRVQIENKPGEYYSLPAIVSH